MRIAPGLLAPLLAVPVFFGACLLSACAVQHSSLESAFIDGTEGARAAQAQLDAEAILQGMNQARTSDERVARTLDRGPPDAGAPPVTR